MGIVNFFEVINVTQDQAEGGCLATGSSKHIVKTQLECAMIV